ncbi:MAG: hypothetical protein P0S95_04175 [Rhabdochlamydiaceae bacterium]|nr:hypothetical protein [Candidatus Amphrikana amoebophyrae]
MTSGDVRYALPSQGVPRGLITREDAPLPKNLALDLTTKVGQIAGVFFKDGEASGNLFFLLASLASPFVLSKQVGASLVNHAEVFWEVAIFSNLCSDLCGFTVTHFESRGEYWTKVVGLVATTLYLANYVLHSIIKVNSPVKAHLNRVVACMGFVSHLYSLKCIASDFPRMVKLESMSTPVKSITKEALPSQTFLFLRNRILHAYFKVVNLVASLGLTFYHIVNPSMKFKLTPHFPIWKVCADLIASVSSVFEKCLQLLLDDNIKQLKLNGYKVNS